LNWSEPTSVSGCQGILKSLECSYAEEYFELPAAKVWLVVCRLAGEEFVARGSSQLDAWKYAVRRARALTIAAKRPVRRPGS
jgi:hypothetical protein